MKKTIFMVMLLLLTFSLYTEPMQVMNDIILVFPEGSRAEIEASVVEGAINFLEAKGYGDFLLCEYEKSAKQPFNYESALNYAEKALAALDKSIDAYGKSLSLAKQAGYVSQTIDKFNIYDYDGFALREKLGGDMMAMVKAYFLGGDIVGAYRQNVDNIAEIRITLQVLKEKLAQGKIPVVSQFSQLLQQLAKTALFGNYCTTTAMSVFKN